jgi:hypothetical protein
MKLNFLFTLILISNSILSNDTSEKGKQDVYVAGNSYNNEGESRAILWKNGRPQYLTSEKSESAAYSVYVSNNDVYVVGYEYTNGKSYAMLWKNGVAQQLSNGRYSACAWSIYVTGDDVYVAGNEFNEEKKLIATVWKNGIPIRLSKESSFAQSVFVLDNNVYVAGKTYKNQKEVATVWKNGTPQILTLEDYNSEALSVFATEKDVYVAGHENSEVHKSKTIIWKNGEVQHLTVDNEIYGGVTNCIYVSNEIVYVVGNLCYSDEFGIDDVCIPLLWKNNKLQGLKTKQNETHTSSVFVSGKDIYVAGFQLDAIAGGFVAMLWKNGKPQRLTINNMLTIASSVFVY